MWAQTTPHHPKGHISVAELNICIRNLHREAN